MVSATEIRFGPVWGSADVLLAEIRFDYASSAAGQPVVTLPIQRSLLREDALLGAMIDEVVRQMERQGSAYHGSRSMPSLDSSHYCLVTSGRRVQDGEHLRSEAKREASFPPRWYASTELAYIGPFGHEQIAQAYELGGKESLAIARRHVEWARQFA